MISNQIIQTSIDELKTITKVDIYVFDEATSNIDIESEAIIMANIKALSGEKAVIVISHRLANVTPADLIYYMESGELKATGTHRELMEEQGLYRRFIQMREAAIGWNLRRKEELSANDGNL